MFQIRLKELREKKNLSQAALGLELGVAQSTIGNWEAGIRQPNLETVSKLADYFQVPVDYLLGRGVFANWDKVMANKKHIIWAIEKQTEYAKRLDLNNQPEMALMHLFSLLFAKIEISDDNENIALYPFIPLSDFDKVFNISLPEPEQED